MEHILVSQISRHLTLNNILLKNQHGFRNGLSCETQLAEFVNDLHVNQSGGGRVDAVVMDFSKAFDKVAHGRLLFKLGQYGIDGKTRQWIHSFLTGRSQCVVVDGEASPWVPVTSGVPQGSVLGPILFLIYINDISSNISSNIRLFADDTIIYRTINDETDSKALQTDLNTLADWSRVWQMEFHPGKCNVIHFTRSRSPFHTKYHLYDQELETVSSVKYLGVTISSDLRWNKHTTAVRNAASGSLRFLQP
jgi:hypothetical protein